MSTADNPGQTGSGSPAAQDSAVLDAASAAIRVVSGTPTPDELAAVTAVIAGMQREELTLRRKEHTGPSAWDRAARGIREPVQRGTGAWRGF